MEKTNALQEPMEEEIAETGSSLDEKEEESDDQKEDECYVPVDSFEISAMGKTCDNSYAPVIYDNLIFMPNFEMHGTKEFCLENVYDKALDDDPILNDQSPYYKIVKSGFECFNPTIFELDKKYVFVDH